MLNEKQIDAVILLIKAILFKKKKYAKLNRKVNKGLYGDTLIDTPIPVFLPIDVFLEDLLYQSLDILIANSGFEGTISYFMELQASEDDGFSPIEEGGKIYPLDTIEDLETYLKRNL